MKPAEPAWLIAECLAGNETAIETLIHEHEADVFRLALSITGDTADAHEIAQETFISALRSLPSYKEQKSFRAWLYAIALNQSRTRLRKRKVLERLKATTTAIFHVETQKQTSLEERVIQSEKESAIWNELNKMDERHRMVVILKYFQDLSVAEISEVLTVNEGTIHSRLHTARRKIERGAQAFNGDRMITHEEARKLIHLKADGTLNLEQQTFLQAHLMTCEECTAYAEEIKQTEDILKTTLQKHWKAAPLTLSVSTIKAALSTKKNSRTFLSIRRLLIGFTVLALGFATWQFTLTSKYSGPTTTVEASLIPTPQFTYTSTHSQENKTYCGQIMYQVRADDTLETIAQQFSTTKERLMELNGLLSESIPEWKALIVPFCITPYTPTFTATPTIQLTTYTPQ